MPRRWQYPAKVQPVSTAQETVTVDRWAQPQSQPFPYRPYRPAAQYPSFFWHVSTAKEAVSEDRWHQPQSQPYPFRAYRPASFYPSFFAPLSFTAPEVITPDKWYPEYPDQLRGLYPRATFEAATQIPKFIGPEVTSVDRWSPEYPDRLPRPYSPALLQFLSSPIAVISPAEIVTMDKWFRPWEQPKPVQRMGPGWPWFMPSRTTVFPEVITMDKWHVDQPQPFPLKPNRAALMASGLFWSRFTPAPSGFLLHKDVIAFPTLTCSTSAIRTISGNTATGVTASGTASVVSSTRGTPAATPTVSMTEIKAVN